MRSNSLSTQLKPLPRALTEASARLLLSLPYYTSASQQSTQYFDVVVQQAVFIDIVAPVLMPLSLTSRVGSKSRHDSCRKGSLLSSESHEIQSSFQRYNSKTRLQPNEISYTLFDFAIRTAFQPTLRARTVNLPWVLSNSCLILLAMTRSSLKFSNTSNMSYMRTNISRSLLF